jgi:serine phosphatase RsbU (regulator of sigma subunit)
MNNTNDNASGFAGAAVPANGAIYVSDLDLAERVQQLLLPKSSPACSWCCIGVKNRMASGLGGDYFDFITMPDQCQSLFIGDVTGHGLHASIVMSLVYGFIHRAAIGSCAPLELVQQVNAFLLDFARRSQTIDHYFSSSLFYGIIHPKTLTMHFVNAGHVPVLVLRKGVVRKLESTGPPVGFFDAPEMQQQTFHCAPGDRLLFYTDGITETENASGELFGLERVKRLLRASAAEDYMEFLDRLFASFMAFGPADPPQDDCTAIVIDLHGRAP